MFEKLVAGVSEDVMRVLGVVLMAVVECDGVERFSIKHYDCAAMVHRTETTSLSSA